MSTLVLLSPSPLVDCPTQLTVVIRVCQVCSMTTTREKYDRTHQRNLLLHLCLSDRLASSLLPEASPQMLPLPFPLPSLIPCPENLAKYLLLFLLCYHLLTFFRKSPPTPPHIDLAFNEMLQLSRLIQNLVDALFNIFPPALLSPHPSGFGPSLMQSLFHPLAPPLSEDNGRKHVLLLNHRKSRVDKAAQHQAHLWMNHLETRSEYKPHY